MKEQEYFVSFLDILGFKRYFKGPNGELKNVELEKLYRSLEKIFDDLVQHLNGTAGAENFAYMNHSGQVVPGKPLSGYEKEVLDNKHHFSDTIIFFIPLSKSKEDNVERLRAICKISNLFISKAILYDRTKKTFDLPLRGAIACGNAIVDTEKNIHIGEPFVDAYELAEAQEWMGGAIHGSVPEEYVKPLLGYDNEVYEYDIPLKEKYKGCYEDKEKNLLKYSLNWVRHHRSLKRYVDDITREGPDFEDLWGHVKKHNWKGVEYKRDNTKPFIEKICKEFDTHENEHPPTDMTSIGSMVDGG